MRASWLWDKGKQILRQPEEIPVAKLIRVSFSDHGTIGILLFKHMRWFTIELPWRNNQQNISCIPSGKFWCDWSYSPKFDRDMIMIEDVPGRSGIRIHSGNLAGDTSKGLITDSLGCPLLGREVGHLQGQRAVLVSRPAVKEFEKLTGGKGFYLEVV